MSAIGFEMNVSIIGKGFDRKPTSRSSIKTLTFLASAFGVSYSLMYAICSITDTVLVLSTRCGGEEYAKQGK
jgi:lipid-A-disaccharide synthase-like uncharacterized protein